MQPYNPAMYDTYRLKLFRDLLDRRYQELLSPHDLSTYRHVDNLYRLGFWSVFASLPLNFYFGYKSNKTPNLAKSYMFKSLGYMAFSTVLFVSSIWRYQQFTKELSGRYLTNLSTQELELQVNQSKGIYMPQ